MKRTIKFRAQAIHNGEWVYGLPSHYNRDPKREKWMICDEDGLGTDIDKETLCQFTGLHDKKGNEIYEGDIIYSEFSDGSNCHCLVGWNDKEVCFGLMDEYAFRAKQEGYDFPKFNSLVLWNFRNYGTKFEVVGNIYDNPHSLNLPEIKPRKRKNNEN